jgi:hypothetical protein
MSLPLRRLSEATLLIVTVISFCIPSLSGQAALPKYDLATETKMKGTVQELKLPEKGSDKDGAAHLMVKSGADTLDVYLCPKSFLEDMGSTLAKGDEVSLTGSKVKQDGADMILAREVVKGNDTLVLRDDKGKPVWNWHK